MLNKLTNKQTDGSQITINLFDLQLFGLPGKIEIFICLDILCIYSISKMSTITSHTNDVWPLENYSTLGGKLQPNYSQINSDVRKKKGVQSTES